jgi:integrase/recombinase XerD
MTESNRTPVREKAKQLSKLLKKEQPDYNYLLQLFRHIRENLGVQANVRPSKKLPYVPTEEDMGKYYKAVWKSKNMQHVVMIKTLLYTGVRVSELIRIKLSDIDLESCQIKINHGKGKKDRIVPFPVQFREVLAVHIENVRKSKSSFLFESSWKRPYSDRGVRKILAKYTEAAGIEHSISPHKLRHFLFTWMKKKGVDDALIQPYSGHESRKSLEIYSKLSLSECQDEYENQIKDFPI